MYMYILGYFVANGGEKEGSKQASKHRAICIDQRSDRKKERRFIEGLDRIFEECLTLPEESARFGLGRGEI